VFQLDSKVEIDERIDHPIHALNFLSGETIILTFSFIDSATKILISFVSLSANSLNFEVSPDNITALYKYLFISISHF
jgi:hypothetical protein